MRTRLFHAILVAGSLAGPAWAEGGLSVDADQVPWPRLQTRIGVAAGATGGTEMSATGGYSLQGARVLGDYYFSTGPLFGSSHASGGFRATSGVMLAPRGPSLSMPTVPRPGGVFNVSQQGLAVAGDADSGHAVPYLGVGYTGLANKGGWGFTADIGLMGLTPGAGLKFGRTAANSQSLDEVLRDLRLTPVLQVGLSYSF